MDTSSSAWVHDGPTNLTSFGKIAELLSSPKKCIGDALVTEGAGAPKPYIPPEEVRMLPSAAGGLLLDGTAFTTMRTIFLLPFLSWSLDEKTKTFSTMTAIQTYATYSSIWHWKAIKMKSRRILVFNSGKCSGRLRGYHF